MVSSSATTAVVATSREEWEEVGGGDGGGGGGGDSCLGDLRPRWPHSSQAPRLPCFKYVLEFDAMRASTRRVGVVGGGGGKPTLTVPRPHGTVFVARVTLLFVSDLKPLAMLLEHVGAGHASHVVVACRCPASFLSELRAPRTNEAWREHAGGV